MADVSRGGAEVETIESDDAPASPVRLEIVPRWIQIPVAVVGYLGFSFSIYGSSGATLLRPVFSLEGLAWLAFAFVVSLINRIDHIGIVGARFSFRTKLERTEKAVAKTEFAVQALETALSDYADLVQNWLNTVNLLDEQIEKYASNSSELSDIVAGFCLDRIEEARDIIGVAGEHFRFSLWWYSGDAGGLTLLLSDTLRNEATRHHVFRPGYGLCGQCFVEDRIYNYANAPAASRYESIGDDPEYHGLLLVPVKLRTDGGVLGVLSIDRIKKDRFDANAENVASGLSHLLAYAMSATTTLDGGGEEGPDFAEASAPAVSPLPETPL